MFDRSSIGRNIINEAEWYNKAYGLHHKGEEICRASIHDEVKARRRVGTVLQYFKLSVPLGGQALDVGCGLGYYTDALNYLGFKAIGIDISEVAIKCAREKFPGIRFEQAIYPEDMDDCYDLIWAVDVTSINALEPETISSFVRESLARLKDGGILILGWHTDFSGRMKRYLAHWDLCILREVRGNTGISFPAIVQTRFEFINRPMIYGCKILGKSAPIFMVLIK